jgi:predicted extracellular nuclease
MKLASIFRRAFCTVAAATLIAAPAFAVSPNIVISQVYGGGGNAGATLRNDYVELFNRGTTSVSVAGWSVQYAATGGSTWNTTPLTGTIPAGRYFLVQMASGGAVGTLLPTPDITGVTNMAAGAGKVALVNIATVITNGTACPTGATIVDFVGYGPATTCSETTPTTPNISATLAAFRAAGGCTDTDSNVADFANATPNARNSATATNSCSPLPNLTINSVTANEGNSGITPFTFTVTLSAAAPTGGVTFDIATANNTATAGSDYTAKSLTAQNIPAGNTSYTFTVDVLGDITPETSETFLVNVTNVVNANITTGQGTGTITNDDAAANLTINDVTLAEGNSGTTTFAFTVSLSAPAPAGGVTFDIATADGTTTAGSDYAAQNLTGQIIPAGSSTYTFNVAVNGDTVGELTETFFVNITNVVNAIPLDAQGLGTITNDDATPIHTVQGSGNQSPLAGTVVTVEGIVTADFQGANQLSGFYIQTPDAEADADVTTSQGIFVYTNLAPYTVTIGDRVRVSATVIEFGTAPNTLTELVTPVISTISNGNALPAIVDVALPIAAIGDLERYEGMRVRFTQSLTVSDHFDLAHFGEVTLTANSRALQPTNEVDLNDAVASGTTSSGNSNGAAVIAFDNLNKRSSILLDDASTLTYPAIVPFVDPVDHTLRLGSTISNLTGILSQAFGAHRLYATVAPAFAYAPRPVTPPAVGGNVKVASANVLNYFNGNGLGGGFPTARGADSPTEFARQRAKTVAALNGLGADVIGLLEMENDGVGAQSAIQDLINGLNAAAGPGTWNFIADPANYSTVPGGTDAIRPIFIYKTAVVAPVGLATTISDSAFVIARAPVAQTFRLLANNEQFVAVINHFKAKSSGGATGLDIDQNDGQANFNATRKLQAVALIGFINTLAANTPRVITFGDFNAYEQEDPMDVLRAGGLSTIINNSYSYMFNGLSGSLDHALGNAAMMATVSGFGKWHINADEPVYLDYNVETKNTAGCTSSCTTPDYFAATPFRASDHDPVLVGLNLIAAQTITFPAITSFSWSGGSATVAATASSGLTVTYNVVSGPCANAGATVTSTGAGTCVIAADQAGNASYNAAPQVTQSVTVTAAAQTIAFPTIPPFSWSGGSATLAATASSGLAVTYSMLSGPCSISGTTLAATTSGTCTIAADQAGNINFSAASQVTQTATISSVDQTITFPTIAGFSWSGGSTTLAASASSGLAVSYSVVSGPCVNSASTVTATGAGACTIAANQAGNTSYNAAPQVTQLVTVSAAPQTITFPAIPPFSWSGGSTTLAASSSSGLAITYSVASGACAISGATLTATAAGNCVIAANQSGNINFTAAAQVTQPVTVTAIAQTITFPVITSFPWSGGSATLAATASSGLAITYSVVSGSCAISGVTLTATAGGACVIAANQAGNTNYSAATQVTQSATATAVAQTITFPAIAPFLTSGSATLAATASSGLGVTYSVTSGPCAVSGNTVTATAGAVCVIAANQAGNASYSAAPPISQSVTVTAPATAQTITFPAITSFIWSGGSAALAATASSGLPVSYGVASGPCAIAGTTLTATGAGMCSVTASQAGNASFNAATSVTNSVTVLQAPQTITFGALANQVLSSTALLVNSGTTNSGLPITLISLTPTVCEIANVILPPVPGNIRGINLLIVGTCTLRASQSGDTNFLPAASVDQSFQITAATGTAQTIDFPLIANQVGALRSILIDGGRASSGLQITRVSLTPSVCETFLPILGTPPPGTPPNTTGVRLLSNGTCIVRASQAGDATFAAASNVDRSFTISAGALSELTLAPNIINPRTGTPITLTALVRGVTPSGTITFTTTPVTDITAPTVTIQGCANLSVSSLQADSNATIATCVTLAEPGARRYTATYSNDSINTVNPAAIITNSPLIGPLDYNDIWWAGPAESGWGMTIAQKGTQQFNAFYVYDAAGKPVWYVMGNGVWNQDYTKFTGSIYQPTGSLFSNYDARLWQIGASLGTATITFTDANNAVFDYTLSGVTAKKNITRFIYGTPDAAPKITVKDIWWAGEAENGWGVTIAQQDRSLFAAWYTYGTDGKATWFVMSGGTWAGTIYTGTLYTTTSSPWLGVPYNATQFRTQPVGTISFDFRDQDNAKMTYTVNGVTQTKSISRFAF